MLKISDIAEDQILFYDIETDHQYAPYCKINKIGVQYGFEGKRERVVHRHQQNKFRKALADPDILRVGFNSKNFDDIVLARFGYPVEEQNSHDVYLMFKTIYPDAPSYGLKFLNWWLLDDPHFPEMDMYAWSKKARMSWVDAPDKFMNPYLQHDLRQTQNVFCIAWEIVQRPEHWEPYMLLLRHAAPLQEMTLEGGLFLDRKLVEKKIATLQKSKQEYENSAYILSDGEVENPNSSKQLGAYLDSQGFELELSSNGQFAVRKADLVDIKVLDPVAECAFQIRRINGNLKYFENYLQALRHNGIGQPDWIPTAYSNSNARTRRETSSSYFGLNFQNPNEEAKTVQVVPPGWLGFWVDSTQVENVVHIYESGDDIRRRAYEADPNWSEYVWLCNRILGTNQSKDELDAIPSEQIPNWSVYKQYKTVKLALNFGMGIDKFCRTTGVPRTTGRDTFDTIHDACPAIRSLQDDIGKRYARHGYVEDVFGHRYSHPATHKLVAYLIQGTGTGILPKAQIRANYDVIHSYDRGTLRAGCLCTTTHDENSGRLNLELGTKTIIAILQQIHENMSSKFSPLFGGIPLRAKLYLSKTTAANHVEVPITDLNWIRTVIEGRACQTCNGAGKKCKICHGKGYIK